MLSEAARPLIASTAPVIAARLPAITPDFYRRLFIAHPDLLDGTFSRANHASGRQSSALASSIVAFALAILRGDHPVDLVERIAHRHASLGVVKEQYAVVFEHLFAAIAADLGDAATDDVVAAWTEVYWMFANLLVARERSLSGEQANDVHWALWRVTSFTPRAGSTREITFEPADGTPVSSASAGQYVSVRVRTPDGARQARQYSLLTPGLSRRLGVKLDSCGDVSPVIHRLVPGNIVELSNPYGTIVLDDRPTPLILATAGIGCTPAISFLEGLIDSRSKREVIVLHADRSEADWGFSGAIRTLVEQLPTARLHTWFEDQPERPRMDLSEVALPSGVDVFLCGSLGFMQGVRHQAISTGIPDERIRYEMFGPDAWLKSA